jgi:serpin B
MQASEKSTASSAVNELGIELHCALAKEHANLCISPLSIQMALVMAYAGADGQTREEMAKVLRYPPDDKALNDSFSALAASLDGMCRASVERAKQSERFGARRDPIVMTIANRLFGKRGYDFRPSFVDLLKSVYLSPLTELDFEGNPEKARGYINGWVEDQTKKRIRDLIPEGGISATTRMVLANALYLKAPWEKEFDERATKPEPFHIDRKAPANLPTMTQKIWARYSEESSYTAVALSYAGGELQFVILLPEKVDGLGELEGKLSASMFTKCEAMPAQEIMVHLPKFKLDELLSPIGNAIKQESLMLRHSTDQQQPGRTAWESFGSAMDARWNWAAGIIDGDAPEVAEAERKRLRVPGGGVVKIVTVLVQVFAKAVAVFLAKEIKKPGAGFGDIDAPDGFIVAQSLGCRLVVAAKPGIGGHRGAVGMEGIDIGGHRL